MTVPEDIRQWRKAQRAELLARRRSISVEQHREWTAAITQLLVTGFPLLQRMTVSFYWPFQGEFDPRFAIHHFRQGGATVALPEVTQKAAPLQFRQWWPGIRVTPGVFDLPVPDGTVVTPEALLIPPVGFDAQGYRLGYGGGYFDRTLAAMPSPPLKIGVAFELSRMATIHPQAHDVAMDFMVTEAGIHRVGKTGLERLDPRHAAECSDAMMHARRDMMAERNDDAPRQYASSPCYAAEFDYWQEGKPDRAGDA